jgi:hypothetical protein
MQDQFHPPAGEFARKHATNSTACPNPAAYTETARLNYANGIAAGLQDSVREALALTQTPHPMLRFLTSPWREGKRLRQRKQRARLERARLRCRGDGGATGEESSGGSEDEDDVYGDEVLLLGEGGHEGDLEQHVAKLEGEERAARAIVVHAENVAQRLLQDANIELVRGESWGRVTRPLIQRASEAALARRWSSTGRRGRRARPTPRCST